MKRMLMLASFALVAALGCDQYDRPTVVTPDRTTNAPPAMTSPAPPRSETATTPSGLPTMSDTDRALAQRVEQMLREDTTLATAAQNIQVHASNGQVTLMGSVSSQQEKTDLESKAQQVAGVTQVNNQLTVG
jgi:hypothetical protein